MTTFTGTVYWCNIHEATRLPQNDTKIYSLCVDVQSIPTRFHGFVRPQQSDDLVYHMIQQPFRPILAMPEPGDYLPLRRLRDQCEIANIRLDRLFHGLTARLAVDVVDVPLRPFQPDDEKRQIRLLAVQFNFDDVEKRFHHLVGEYFQ